MSELLADRFVERQGRWIHSASGHTVLIQRDSAGTSAHQLDWNHRCAILADLRHPLLNPLIDFGTIGRDTFEAYEDAGPFRASASDAGRMRAHLARFVDAHGLALAALPPLAFRRHDRVRGGLTRALGVTLQRRDALAVVADALDVAGPAGVCVIDLHGPPQCGLRTLRVLAARLARVGGYVPVDPTLPSAPHWLAELVSQRHLCLLIESDAAAGEQVAGFLARLEAAGGRRHLVVRFSRAGRLGPARSVPVDPLGVVAMTNMVFADPEEGPSAEEVSAEARRADGRPGALLARLGLVAYDPPVSRAALVHERPDAYGGGPLSRETLETPRSRRTAQVALRAAERAAVLAQRGRHAAAARLLARASRILRARGEAAAAARCAEQRGWLNLDRARIDAAVSAFQEARDLHPEGASSVAAATGIGVAWIEDGRLTEAEAALRNAILAARSLGEPALAIQATTALGRCLCWQGRFEEAAVALSDASDPHVADADRAAVAAVSARVHLMEGAPAPALRAARQAVQLASATPDLRAQVVARRALAAALLAVGDVDHSREQIDAGLASARRARVPLEALRLRLILLEWLASDPAADAAARRLAARLASASTRLPRLLRYETRAACARVLRAEASPDVEAFVRASGAVAIGVATGRTIENPAAELEAFLEIGRSASDDRAALDRMCEDVLQKGRAATVMVVVAEPGQRVLALAGRPWPGEPHAAWRALTGGGSVPIDPRVEPCHCAEPLRYSGAIVGAIACRWTAGSAIDAGRSQALLRFGGLAMAPHVRALLDRVPAAAGGATWKDLIGESAPTRALREAIVRAARAPFCVLIEGESGSGKELVARAIHRLGPRRDRRFCALNCAALSDDLLEAELFGHVRGAFTGAVGDRPGLFEDADGGTLFLDEIGELSARAQAKLLRVLQDGEVRRVGENVSRRVDVRIVAATNRRLEEEAAAGRFRADLRFRLDVVRIEVPPLRERASDVPILASHFWMDAAARVGSRATLSPDALAALSRYDWPGNVRELQNVIAWMAVHSPTRGRVGPAGLPGHLARASAPAGATFEAAREDFERRFVRAALATANGHRLRAAASLGVTRQGLAKMLRRLRIEGEERE